MIVFFSRVKQNILRHFTTLKGTIIFACMVALPRRLLSLAGLAFPLSGVKASVRHWLKTKHGVSHSHLNYASASYSSLATPEGMLITFSLALNYPSFSGTLAHLRPTLLADREDRVNDREGERGRSKV